MNYYQDAALDDVVDVFMREQRVNFVAGSGFPDLRGYLNYAHGDEGPEVWYGKENLARLSALKRRWDLHSRFGAGFPIPINLV